MQGVIFIGKQPVLFIQGCINKMETLNVFDVCFFACLFWAVMYVVYGVATSVERALFEATGETYASLASSVWTWGYVNPTWAWDLMDKFDPKQDSPAPRYFSGVDR